MGGIRAELTVESPPDCPTARASEAAGGAATSVTKSVPADPEEPVTEEFVLDGEIDPASGSEGTAGESLREIFSYGDERVYRFERTQERTCFCECIERFDCPISEVRSEDGRLSVTFHAPDIETLRSVVSRLDERWTGVSVRRLVQSGNSGSAEDLVLVDRSDLTDRQREVLATAHEMGYFAYPKRANAEAVAAELDIDPSTFAEHVAAAQDKLLAAILP
jgi:predicted DNA binding protein